MNPANKPSLPRWQVLSLALTGWLLASVAAFAQTGTGTIQGRVYNPVSQGYVRDAEVRLDRTAQVTYTENDGSFQFANVPAGPAAITVTYTGYNTVKESFTVSAGQVAVREINLSSTAAQTAGAKDGIVKLEAFTVSTEREGNAKAIMAQRRDMNIMTSVSSDIFGDVTDGNVGEFLKYLPGVDLDYVESEARGPRLGGMEGQYVGVSFDGMRSASADANRGGGSASRATSFEGFSITAIESIEINLTASPENDGDSPGGTVNMRTKRAFDRKGRIFTYNFGLNFNDEEFTFAKTPGPRDKADRKVKPNLQLQYSESFFNQRFGILLSATRAHSYTEQQLVSAGYNRTRLPHDDRPLVIRQIDFKDGPKFILKDSLLLTADWKVTPRLVLSTNLIYSYFEGEFWNRNFTFVAANDNANVNTANGRSSVDGDGVLTVIANRVASGSTTTSKNNTVATLNNGGGSSAKLTYTKQIAPRFEYRAGLWVVDGAAAFSRSVNNYESVERGFSNNEGGGVPSSWVATRPHPESWEWTIRQTSGPDWYDLSNFTSTDARSGGTRITNDNRTWATEKWTGTLNAKLMLPFLRAIPSSIKVGAKWDEETRKNGTFSDSDIQSYFGPGGNTMRVNATTGANEVATPGNWMNVGPEFVSPNPFEMGTSNAMTVYNLNGVPGMPPRVSRYAIADLYHAHPELFINTATPENYYSNYIASQRDFPQTVTAGYAQADMRLFSRLQLRFGTRLVQTENALTEYDPLTRAQMLASPYASQLNAPGTNGGRPRTLEGIQYMFYTNPRVTRTSEYRNWFPSIQVKYNILPNLEWQAGANKGIGRAPIDNLNGLWVIDENALRVTAPNPDLQPEQHKVFRTRLAYYFSGRSPGQLSLTLAQNEATNFITAQDYSASEFGVEDPDFTAYTFRSTRNYPGLQKTRSMDFAYNQTLGFLPSLYLRGLSVGLNYSRTYATVRRPGLTPHRASGRLGYSYRRFNCSIGAIWADDRPESSTYGRYFGALTKYDITFNLKLNRWCDLYAQGRNISNVKDRWYESPPGVPEGQQGVLRALENYGANWVFGVKGQF